MARGLACAGTASSASDSASQSASEFSLSEFFAAATALATPIDAFLFNCPRDLMESSGEITSSGFDEAASSYAFSAT